MTVLLLLAQESARTAEVPTAMGAHTWFIILAAGSFLMWSISYSLQLQKEGLARRRGRDDLLQRKEQLLDRIADLEAHKEAGKITEQKYKQELKGLKFQLANVLKKIGSKS